ncbi:hypothetical protein GLYMA_02G090332v4 [Glycine max]|nr:hypothetical protein GLYMA_02G090332v4 [Glycine max]KAH1059470.1 hypothetical protein GYH30_003469 [Glycine max]
MFRSLSALSLADVLPAVYLCNTKIGADHENKGDVAQECRQTHKSVVKHRLLATPTPLLIKDVFSALQKISVGSGSTSRKKGIIVHLMHSYCEKEMKFLVRTLVNIWVFFRFIEVLWEGSLPHFKVKACYY